MSHQDRREPLPKDYQFPTHGMDCDCPRCRNRKLSDDVFATFRTADFVEGVFRMVDGIDTLVITRIGCDGYGFGI